MPMKRESNKSWWTVISNNSLLWLLIACNPTTEENAHEGHTMDAHANHSATASDTSLADIVRSINQTVISSQETVQPIVKTSGDTLELNGYITEDPRRNQALSARVGGRIERLYVKYNFQYISKGDRILDLYSPELRTSQEEYLYLLRNREDANLINNARQKLRLLGLSEKQIAQLEQNGEVSLTITLYSPYSGFVLNRTTNAAAAGNAPSASEGMSMGGTTSGKGGEQAAVTQTKLEVREGAYVNAGQTLFLINDFKQLYALLSIDVEDQSFVAVNTPVKVISEISPQKPISGKINLIEPVLSEGVQFMQARVYLDNLSGELKANSLARARVAVGDQTLMMVPSSSIVDLGNRKIVWVKMKETSSGKKVFGPRTVLTGISTDDFTQIISGLEKYEIIAKHAGYLLDSESIIN